MAGPHAGQDPHLTTAAAAMVLRPPSPAKSPGVLGFRSFAASGAAPAPNAAPAPDALCGSCAEMCAWASMRRSGACCTSAAAASWLPQDMYLVASPLHL